MPKEKFSIIYADPPWRYEQKNRQGSAELHYPTMSIEEICSLPVADLAAKDSVLFLWATFPQLPEALKVIKAWGLLWSSIFVTLMANKIGGLQFGIYRNCQISSRVFHTAVAALPLTKANRSDFE